MSKFKKGEKVRVKRFITRPDRWNPEGDMDKWMGQEVTISGIDNDTYRIVEDDIYWFWHESDFEEIAVFEFLEDKDVLL